MKKIALGLLFVLSAVALKASTDSAALVEVLKAYSAARHTLCEVTFTAFADMGKRIIIDTSVQVIYVGQHSIYSRQFSVEMLHTDSFSVFVDHEEKILLIERKQRIQAADPATVLHKLFETADEVSYQHSAGGIVHCRLKMMYGSYSTITITYHPQQQKLLSIEYQLSQPSERLKNTKVIEQTIKSSRNEAYAAPDVFHFFQYSGKSGFVPKPMYKAYTFYNRY